jgi:tRNA (mo5U34)-methyltransferase
MEQVDLATKRRLVQECRPWHHSINLGDGVVTPGGKTPGHHHDDLVRLHLPDLTNKSVLDVGAWDGYYTFMAEGAGASRVVALDHYAWSIDFPRASDYLARRHAAGEPILAFHNVADLWDPIGLPGKRGFDLAHRVLNSCAEAIVDDFLTMDLAPLGTFDVVLFLGVIYHLQEPFRAIERLRQVTGRVAIIESEAVSFPAEPSRPLWEFVDATHFNHDPTVWWVPTAEGLHAMCRAAGFSRVEIVAGPPKWPRFRRQRAVHYRLALHAYR